LIRTTISNKRIATDTNWNDTFDRLQETAPAQSWEPLAALYTAETEEQARRLLLLKLKALTNETQKHHRQSISLSSTEAEEQHRKERSLRQQRSCITLTEKSSIDYSTSSTQKPGSTLSSKIQI
jgi:hypothetical protein